MKKFLFLISVLLVHLILFGCDTWLGTNESCHSNWEYECSDYDYSPKSCSYAKECHVEYKCTYYNDTDSFTETDTFIEMDSLASTDKDSSTAIDTSNTNKTLVCKKVCVGGEISNPCEGLNEEQCYKEHFCDWFDNSTTF